MWKKGTQNISGESLALEAQTLIAKWVARGLNQTVLEKIRTDVFNWLFVRQSHGQTSWSGPAGD